MALDKETREWIASDLDHLTRLEFTHLREVLESPDDADPKVRKLFLGSPQDHASVLLEMAMRRYGWVAHDLKVTTGRRGLLQTIKELQAYIAEISPVGVA